jgi:type II secretory pathway pseudopilin PulG
MSIINIHRQRGDTLVEVLFATAVFSLVAVGSLSIMNQGSATAQRSLEITLVRQELDSQAEALKYLNSSYVSAFRSGYNNISNGSAADQWKTMMDYVKTAPVITSASAFGSYDTCPTTFPSKSFIINARKGLFINPSTIGPSISKSYSQVTYNVSNDVTAAEGIWIEAVRTEPTGAEDNAAYTDFHIRTCWDSPGQAIPMTLGTIVRLYEPK